MHDDHPDNPHAPVARDHPMTEFERRVDAVQTLLIEKGLITADQVRRRVEEMDSRSPTLGAKVIARAWVDPAFKARLLADAKAAIAELGIEFTQEAALVAVENTQKVHHVVVCTLCSCYPRGLLGYPPDWYKSLNYRSRVVVDPRGVLKEFGTEPPPDVEVRVLDSTADMRYLVIPARPAGTEGTSEAELAELVTRDSMIGVAQARTPALR
ncbi:MAG: nitrile hydratase subunit alpha [Candidatus Rokubacteria bacterium]|nr:nitrile hydratase subunit alpha [Candidatus Rokubacteria bacterium]